MKPLKTMVVGLLALSIHHAATASYSSTGSSDTPSLIASQKLLMFGPPSAQALPETFDAWSRLMADALEPEEIERQRTHIALAYLDIAAVMQDENAQAKVGQLFAGQMPILLKMDNENAQSKSQVAALFGISGSSRYTLFYRKNNSLIEVHGFDDLSTQEQVSALEQQVVAWQSGQDGHSVDEAEDGVAATTEHQYASVPAQAQVSNFNAVPSLTFNLSRTGPRGEVSTLANIEIIRSAQRAQDKKFIIVKAKPTTIKSARNGIVTPIPGVRNLWASYLPHTYRASHRVEAAGVGPALVKFAPPSDGRTEFSYSETQTRGFIIGGSVGAEFGPGASDKATYVAKSPFSLGASYEHSNSKTLATSFKDYSLLASSNNQGALWEAPIAPRLRSALIDRVTANGPILTESRMTPMMRQASLETYSVWALPGSYSGDAKVIVGGGYDLQVDEWWRDRTQIRKRSELVSYGYNSEFVLDLSSPYLTREMSVLIRSQDGAGRCLVESGSTVTLAACNAQQKSHLWGLDSESRYVNRGSGKCLTLQERSGALLTETCRIDNRQQWEWRADRIHSLYDLDWRLFVQGTLPSAKPNGSMAFDDVPVNAFNRFNIPWASYPGAPSAGDVMPNENGVSPQISPDWVATYRNPVDARQRWRIEILRDGL
ncbi:ricin-type beta-trefoil lectin domain protein [Pseudomonas gingeri]|uniref:RICIN domain-containing protein n=1 Tax=Pseudomonas gingeri TaxID=117681 RepID=UPI0015A4C2B3|nr:ricin-type beta-trefoil lectin domain protein [Pseudomonas gingeri]NWD69062.1 ricin-type beta-trefoil lectin domain protein [Pseudomonas gingeri]